MTTQANSIGTSLDHLADGELGGPSARIIDIGRRLPLSISYRDFLFEGTKIGVHELKIKPASKEIVVFVRREEL